MLQKADTICALY